MHRDRIKWNDKYLQHEFSTDPSRIVTKHYALSCPGKALDIAAGTGRNSIFLAKHGFSVEAVDISDVGLGQISGLYPDLHPLCVDLDPFDIPSERYILILNIRFLNRRLFPFIVEGLVPGGILIFESYLDLHIFRRWALLTTFPRNNRCDAKSASNKPGSPGPRPRAGRRTGTAPG